MRVFKSSLALPLCAFLLLAPAYGQELPDVTAEIQSTSNIIVSGSWAVSARNESDYRLEHLDGTPIPIAEVLPRRSQEVLIIPDVSLDPRRLHRLHITGRDEPVLVRRNDWFKSLYSHKPLGANVSDDASVTDFRLFAPRAERVTLHLYLDRFQALDRPDTSISMARDHNGVWEAQQPGNHHGVFYTFTVDGPDEPGNYFFGTHPEHLTDPYAYVSDDTFGKAMVYKLGDAPKPVEGGRPAMEDVIAYEVHVQDFTDRLPLPDHLSGTMLGMIEPGLTNEIGAPVGFDHLLELGINVVHLMPTQEYLHYPQDEWQAAFADDPYMQEQGVSMENYQWGYRTTHAFAVESRFRSKNAPIGAERAEFKQLIEAFHEHGISVIIDVVPNHTGENMDGRHYLFNFNAIDLPYYYRTDDQLRHIGPFGNETRPEDRPMVQRWMLDQLRHWVETLGVDGFRIDLAGQIDEQTLAWIKRELPEDLIIYGEAWIAPTDPVTRADPDLYWYKADAPITFFQDDARNAFKGPVSNPSDPAVDRGYAGGDGSQRERAMMGLMNSFPEEVDPNRGINYLDIHDNWALADRFSDEDWDGRKHVDEAGIRIAATLLFTSLGPLVIHGGTEMLRSKGAAPLMEIVKTTATGDLAYHGKRDTYNHRKANQFEWEYAGASPGERPSDYGAMNRYWQGLIALRNSDAGAIFRVGGQVSEEHYQWFAPENNQLLGYVAGDVLVLMNTSWDAATFDISELPAGTWMQISDGTVFVENGCECTQTIDAQGPASTETIEITVPSRSAPIWVRSQD